MAISPTPIPWGQWMPDLSDINAPFTQNVRNVLPRADGYMPFRDYGSFTDTLPGTCRGFFFARAAGALMIFAGTETELYQLDNTTFTWVNVSQAGGPYTALTADTQWQFDQFNNIVIAVQENERPQQFDTTGDTEFSDLGGSPPQARYVSVINRFLVLSGLLSNPYRVQWSDLNDIEEWSTGLSDSQDMPDGGTVRGVVGGEFGIIIQDLSMRRMIFSPGSDVVFQIDRISKDTGALAPYSIINAGDRVFFLSPRGFMSANAAGQITPIGKERIDRTFLSTFDDTNLQLVIGAVDPAAHQVYWTYKSRDGGTDGLFDQLLIYDWVLDRWTPIDMRGEYLAPLARPGLTLESLDAIAPGALTITGAANNGSGLIRITVAATATLVDGGFYNISNVGGVPNASGTWEIDIINGTTFDLLGSTFGGAYTSGGVVGGSIDAMDASLDTYAVSDLARIAMASTDHSLGFFSGDTLEATLETAEQADLGHRSYLNGLIPVTDAASVAVSVAMRGSLAESATYGDEVDFDEDGLCPVLEEGRYLRAKQRIAAGTEWTYATGIIPDAVRGGAR